MKIITHKDIVSLNIPVTEVYAWTKEMIEKKSGALLPPKISIKPASGVFCNVMPSMISEGNNQDMTWGGVKVVTRYPDRQPALDSNILFMNAQTGEFLALMDGNWITAMRTGAVAAHSIITLAKKDYKTIGIIGLGNVSRAALLVLLEVEKEKEFVIKLLAYKNQEEDFIERFKEYKNITFETVYSYEEAVKGSDVVISGVTYAPQDFCTDDVFEEGVLVVPIHTLGFTNCDLFFDKVFGDDTGHICGFRNFSKFKSFTEMTDVVNGRKPGRENDKERILAYNVGVSTHDINFAAHIYSILQSESNLPECDMQAPSEKFWI